MGSFWQSLCLLVLGLVGAQAAALSNHQLSFKSSVALPTNGSRLGIFHGEKTSIEKHPYLAAVLYNNQFLSAATIISDSWVLLSADSSSGLEPNQLSVLVGSNSDSSGKKYAVKEVVVHPKYGYTFLDYDFGLLKIKGKFKFSKTVKKAKLPKKAVKAGSEAVVVGWGETKSGDEDRSLKDGKMKFLSNKECDADFKSLGLTLTDRMGCTYSKGKVTPCENDWSDPMIQDDTVYQLFIAIATNGECTKRAFPAINSDVFSVVKWIEKTIKAKDDEE